MKANGSEWDVVKSDIFKISGPALSVALTSGSAFALTAAPASPADTAQGPTNLPFQDIIVTTRKRTEGLIDVPLAATVLGREALWRYNSTNLS